MFYKMLVRHKPNESPGSFKASELTLKLVAPRDIVMQIDKAVTSILSQHTNKLHGPDKEMEVKVN